MWGREGFYLGGNEIVTFFQQSKKLIYYHTIYTIHSLHAAKTALTSHMHLRKDSIILPVRQCLKWKKLVETFMPFNSSVMWRKSLSQLLKVLVVEGAVLSSLFVVYLNWRELLCSHLYLLPGATRIQSLFSVEYKCPDTPNLQKLCMSIQCS